MSCSLNLPPLTISAASVLPRMPKEEENLSSTDDSSKKVTGVRTKMLDRQRVRVDQTVREVVGLSVAVILGINIGDGNLRDRLLYWSALATAQTSASAFLQP